MVSQSMELEIDNAQVKFYGFLYSQISSVIYMLSYLNAIKIRNQFETSTW